MMRAQDTCILFASLSAYSNKGTFLQEKWKQNNGLVQLFKTI